MLESILLGMVLEEDLTGYDIKKRIETGIGVFYKASFGSLYPALKKMLMKSHRAADKRFFIILLKLAKKIFMIGSPPQ